jgi:hypothetical protein
MSALRTIGLTAAAMMACGAATKAATITQTVSFGPAATAWSHTFSFNGFNPALGTLTKVTDTITETLSGTVTVTNGGSSSATFSAFLTNTAKKVFSGLTVSTLNVSNTVSGTLAPGASSGVLPMSGTVTSTGTTTSGLAGFLGATVSATATDKGSLTLNSDTGNATASFSDDGEVTDKLVYTFTPTVVTTPEPQALGILGGALVLLGLVRLRRRSR